MRGSVLVCSVVKVFLWHIGSPPTSFFFAVKAAMKMDKPVYVINHNSQLLCAKKCFMLWMALFSRVPILVDWAKITHLWDSKFVAIAWSFIIHTSDPHENHENWYPTKIKPSTVSNAVRRPSNPTLKVFVSLTQVSLDIYRRRFSIYILRIWNLLDWASFVTIFVGMGLKISETDNEDVGQVFLVLGFIIVAIRLLEVLCISRILGPKLVMIGNMVRYKTW